MYLLSFIVDITVLVCQDHTKFINWQVQLFYKTFRKFYDYDFISLLYEDSKFEFEYPTFRTRMVRYFTPQADLLQILDYPLVNRALQIKEYLNSTPPQDRYILLCDADFLFCKHHEFKTNSLVSAQVTGYMDYKNVS